MNEVKLVDTTNIRQLPFIETEENMLRNFNSQIIKLLSLMPILTSDFEINHLTLQFLLAV
ncbi:hypothetical protein tinsulaeT_16210 [Thalassotalea insulae]|uniref:Uncharacterized protein n=1 Tax=Thalassotalea insulae TaxID=2056778 RepID=A0ABQ6GQV7_9GAMM|nr:hypothetical protein tinsulaeT_16210 [Thalassotalea insulae]